MFSRKVDALERLSGQKHIVPLLSTFEYKNSYHLRANANLRRYWALFPNPFIDRRYGLWVAKQCKGMAEGLSIIHEPPPDQSDDYAYEAALQPSHQQSQSSQSYGRHGDLKPENIIWFRNGPNTDMKSWRLLILDSRASITEDPGLIFHLLAWGVLQPIVLRNSTCLIDSCQGLTIYGR